VETLGQPAAVDWLLGAFMEQQGEMMNNLECLLQIAPILDRLLDNQDVTLAIANTSEVLHFKDGKSIHVGHVGYQLQQGDGLFEAVHDKREFVDLVPAEVIGIPFRSTAIPIIDESGDAIGVVGMAASLDKQNQIAGIAEHIVESFKQISGSIEQVTDETQKISEAHESILRNAQESTEQTQHTSRIIDFIQNVSSQTKILGLNASIEAARAGDNGRGSSVIAREIRKLADSTKTAVGQIGTGLSTMQSSVHEVERQIRDNAQSIEMQAAATQEVMASIEELHALSEQLFELAKVF
jgi:hypothetical protein